MKNKLMLCYIDNKNERNFLNIKKDSNDDYYLIKDEYAVIPTIPEYNYDWYFMVLHHTIIYSEFQDSFYNYYLDRDLDKSLIKSIQQLKVVELTNGYKIDLINEISIDY